MTTSPPTALPDFAAELRATIDGQARFDAGFRALYATDASNYRHVPVGVVFPHHADDVVATMDVARATSSPIRSSMRLSTPFIGDGLHAISWEWIKTRSEKSAFSSISGP